MEQQTNKQTPHTQIYVRMFKIPYPSVVKLKVSQPVVLKCENTAHREKVEVKKLGSTEHTMAAHFPQAGERSFALVDYYALSE